MTKKIEKKGRENNRFKTDGKRIDVDVGSKTEDFEARKKKYNLKQQ